MSIEHLNDLSKVKQRAGEQIDLVHDNDINLRAPDVSQKPLQSWSLQRCSGVAAIVILSLEGHPALMLLTCNEGLAGFPLRIERVEVLLEALLS